MVLIFGVSAASVLITFGGFNNLIEPPGFGVAFVILAAAGAVAAVTGFVRRDEFARFHNLAGERAFEVGRTGPQGDDFEWFEGRLIEAIQVVGRQTEHGRRDSPAGP
jgi:hypothetical protein